MPLRLFIFEARVFPCVSGAKGSHGADAKKPPQWAAFNGKKMDSANTEPGIDLDDYMLADAERCREPVMSVRKAPGGVWLDYCRDRTGEPVDFCDKPVCATEMVVDCFGWTGSVWLKRHEPVYVPYDLLGDFLAARIRHYFTRGTDCPRPLQIAPIMELFTPKNAP